MCFPQPLTEVGPRESSPARRCYKRSSRGDGRGFTRVDDSAIAASTTTTCATTTQGRGGGCGAGRERGACSRRRTSHGDFFTSPTPHPRPIYALRKLPTHCLLLLLF